MVSAPANTRHGRGSKRFMAIDHNQPAVDGDARHPSQSGLLDQGDVLINPPRPRGLKAMDWL